MIKQTLVMTALATLYAATVWAQGIPQPKSGQCPGGYRSSAGYCTPERRESALCVPKVAQCPSGYAQSGNYCCEMGKQR